MQKDRLEETIDSLDSLVASLVNLKTLPDKIHVDCLRESLPKIAKDLREAFEDKS